MAINNQRTGVRKFLTDSGYKDSDIGYDGGRGMVTLQGKDFYSATPEADGSTYGDYGGLSSTLNNYRTQQQRSQLDSLVPMLTTNATASPAPSFTPQAYGGFNPQASQAFQAAKANVMQDAGTATNNAMVSLGARGIGNSSAAVDRANQIQQSAVSRINNELLPQYEQQDYSRWRDTVGDQRYANETEYARNQDQQAALNQLVNYLTGSIQQGFSNNLATRHQDATDRAANWNAYADSVNMTGNLGTGPKSDWSLLGGTDGAPSWAAQRAASEDQYRNDRATRSDFENDRSFGLQERSTNASIANSAASRNRQDAALNREEGVRALQGDIMNELSQLDNEADVREWLRMNQGYITSKLGAEGFNQIAGYALADFTNQAKSNATTEKAATTLRSQATEMAMKDPAWLDSKTNKQTLINQYMQYLSGQ